jgi:hypothetical protein
MGQPVRLSFDVGERQIPAFICDRYPARQAARPVSQDLMEWYIGIDHRLTVWGILE